MRIRSALMLVTIALAACSGDFRHQPEGKPKAPLTEAEQAEAAEAAEALAGTVIARPVLTAGRAGRAPLSRPAAARPEAYDQTTAEEKAAAAAKGSEAGRKLGSTVASLGNPTEQGFWAKTPLVKADTKGRLVYPASGKSVNVDLKPRPGAGGTQVSLPALQMLGVPLTELPRLDVYAR